MQNPPHQQHPVSPTSSLLPPLSKYYYGPAQGRRSPQKAANQQSLGWDDTNPSARTSTSLSPSQPQSPTTYSVQQWMNHFASQEQASWQHQPGPPPSAPAPNNVPVSSYNPNTYGLMPGGQQPPRSGWSANSSPGSPPDTRGWGVHYNRQHDHGYREDQSPKPPLPPRPRDSYQSSPHSHQPSYSSNHSYDSPNPSQLQQVTYNPHSNLSYERPNDINVAASPPAPSRLPPVPPPRPPEYNSQIQQNQPNQYQAQLYSSAPQDQYFNAPYKEPHRPSHLPPSNSGYSDQYANQHQSFNSQAPHLSNQTEVSVPLRFDDGFAYQSSQQENEQSVSPVNDTDRWRPPTGQDGNQPAFFPSPMPQAATLAGTPGSQQGYGMSNAATQGRDQQVQEQRGHEGQPGRMQASTSTDVERPSLAHNRDDSFYWHSDQSSAQPSRTASGNAQIKSTLPPQSIPQPPAAIPAEEVPRKDSETLSGIPSLAHSPMPAYGASALGFGGPSDWEHFGDYEAEDIDDTELYTKVKSPAADRVPELPVETSPTDKDQQDGVSAQHEPVPASFVPPSPPKPTHENAIVVESINSVEHQPRPKGADDGQRFNAQESKLPPQHQSLVEPEPFIVNVHERSHATASLAASPHKTRESGISISDSPLPGNKRPAPLQERKGSVATSEISPDDPLRKDFDHIIEAWTQPDQEPGQQKFENDEPQKPRALNISPKVVQSEIVKGNEPNTDDTQRGKDGTNAISKPDFAAKDHLQDLDAQESAPTKDSEATEPAFTQADDKAGTTLFREKGKSTGAKLDVPLDFAQKRSASSKRNSIIDVRSSQNTFDDLDPWAIASLNRYVAMLREESKAETNEAKLKIFTVFTTRETRLRAVLYEAEEKKEESAAPVVKTNSLRRSNTGSDKHASKALPALPPNASIQNGAEALTMSRAGSKREIKHGSTHGSVSLSKLETVAQEPTSGNDTEAKEAKEATDDAQYSPGGRPLVERPPRKSIIGDSKTAEKGEKTNGVASDLAEEPAYKPFKYEQGRSEVKAYAANRLSKRNSQYRPYAQLTSEPEPPIPVSADMLAAQEDSQNGVLKDGLKDSQKEAPKERELPPSLVTAPKSKFRVNGIPDPTNATDSPATKPAEEFRPDLRQFVNADFDPLTAVLPKDDVRNETPAQLLDLSSIIDLVPDEFGFIHQAVLAWDGKARHRREINERERHARQVESEQRIDALFDDHDIGYGDISELESEFKRNEAARKADEDRGEYQTFVSEVFDVVWTRLHFEIDQLSPHNKRFTELLDSTTAGQDIFVDKPDNLPLAPTMDALLTLHQKLEIRHQKAFEAVLERDRRLKKTEVSPWYTLGNVAKVKQLERQFETAEKKAIVDYCSQRDARANSLMDVIDQNTLRGVGTNQDYMELIMKAVRRIASGRAFASTPGDTQPDVGLPEVRKAQTVTKALTVSSEQIVQTFHVADMLLNAADYEVSVAKSKQSGADRATFERLKEERAKEDQKLMRDLQHRLALIREDSRKTHDEIVKLLVFLGAQGGQTGNESATKPLPDPSHQERLQKALEEAKRRNERINGVG